MASGRRSRYLLSNVSDGYNCIEVKCPKKSMQKVKWSSEEDERLKRLVAELGTDDWNLIANHFKKRSDSQCQHRWQKVLNPQLVKGPWTKEEDKRVIELVHIYGPKRWSIIAKHLHGRIGKQCRERWHNHLNPEVKKSCWTQEEDEIIYAAHKRIGNRWAEIAKLLPGRTDNSIKNHWNSTMRRKVEQEGYLQDTLTEVNKTNAPIKQRTMSSCSSMRRQNNYFSSLTDGGLTNSTLNSLVNHSMEDHGGSPVYPPVSPTKFLAVEASSVLSSLRTIPEFAETLELIDSFFTVSGVDDLTLDNSALTSTPVCARKRSNTTPFQELTARHLKENSGLKTPKVRKAIMLPMPQTPTPFKTVTASQAKRHCLFKMMLQQPASLAYLDEEGLREESEVDVLNHEETPSDFCSWKHEADALSMRIRKSLDVEPWSTDCNNAQLYPQEQFKNVQIQGESLLKSSRLRSSMLGCEELVCSPPPMVVSDQEEPCRHLPQHALPIAVSDDCNPAVIRILHHLNTSAERNQSEMSCEWDAVLFGKTDDQITVAEQARKFLSSQVPGPASRTLVL